MLTRVADAEKEGIAIGTKLVQVHQLLLSKVDLKEVVKYRKGGQNPPAIGANW